MKRIILYICFLVISCSEYNCSNNKPKNKNESATVVSSPNSIKTDSSNSVNSVIPEENQKPYREKDNLVNSLKSKWNKQDVMRLEKICVGSDGDLSEALTEDATELLDNNLGNFLDYLIKNPNSCLKKDLIEGLGANFSPYSKDERPVKIAEDKKALLEKANSLGLSKDKIKLINEIYNKVDPGVLD